MGCHCLESSAPSVQAGPATLLLSLLTHTERGRPEILSFLTGVPSSCSSMLSELVLELTSTLSSCKCGLTLRSRRGPTASHQARAGGTRYIFTGPGLASCRW